jgi:hypothetical protein
MLWVESITGSDRDLSEGAIPALVRKRIEEFAKKPDESV